MKKISKENFTKSYEDKIFNIVNVIGMVLLIVVFAYPLWFVLIASFSDPSEVYVGNVILLPSKFTWESYKEMIEYKPIWTGYRNNIIYTVGGTVVNLVMTVCCAYPLSRKDFMPRKVLLYLFLFTMYFSGGMIPTYLVVKQLGLINTPWAMIIPSAISVYNMLVVRSYFLNSIPDELDEAARLDGANSAQYLIKVVLPLSKPVLAVVGLYYALGHWNDFYTALLYLQDSNLKPLQYVLKQVLTASSMYENMIHMKPEEILRLMKLQETLKYSTIVAASLPMLCLYPFLQRYFVKGIMVGAIKG